MGLNLNSVYQRPYNIRDNRSLIKQKQDEESSQAQREEGTDSQTRSKGLQYVENEKSWEDTRTQIQGQVLGNVHQTKINAPMEQSPAQIRSQINIAQIIKDFNSTAAAIGTPENLKDEVQGYLSLIEAQVTKNEPNVRLVKSNLKNAATILDTYISETLQKESKVVENWVDALFLQQIDFKYNENDVNPQFLVKFPEGSAQPAAAQTVKQEQSTQSNLVPQDKELKSMFIAAKKLAYANEPKRAIENFEKALVRAQELGDKETESKIFFEVGKIYDDHDYITQALTSYNNAVEVTGDMNVKTKAHFSMAQIYDDMSKITPALDHYFNSISFAGEAENLVAQSTSLSKMANIFTDMYEDDALDYYMVADGLASQTDNDRVKGYVSSGLAEAYEKFGEPQEALKSYSKAVKYYDSADVPAKVAQNYINAAEIMLDYNNLEKAKGLYSKAQVYAGKANNTDMMTEISKRLNRIAG